MAKGLTENLKPLFLILGCILLHLPVYAQNGRLSLHFFELPHPEKFPGTADVITDLHDSLWTVLVNGTQTRFVKSKDGISWYPTSKMFPVNCRLVRRYNGELYAYRRDTGMLLRSVDDGETWTDLSQGLPVVYQYGSPNNYLKVNSITYLQTNGQYLEIYGSYFYLGRIFRSVDGSNWWEVSYHNVNAALHRDGYVNLDNYAIYFDNSACQLDGKIFSCLYRAPLLASYDTGKSWTSLAPLMQGDTTIIEVRVFGNRIVAIGQAHIYFSDNEGASWNMLSTEGCISPSHIEKNGQCYFMSLPGSSIVADTMLRHWKYPDKIGEEKVFDIFTDSGGRLVAQLNDVYARYENEFWSDCRTSTFQPSEEFTSNNDKNSALIVADQNHPAFTPIKTCCSNCLHVNLGGDSILAIKGICSRFSKNTDSIFVSPDLGLNYYFVTTLQHPVNYWYTSHLFQTQNGYTYALRSEKDSVFISVDNGQSWSIKALHTVPPYTKSSFWAAGDCVFWKSYNTTLFSRGYIEQWDTVDVEDLTFLFYNRYDQLYYFLRGNNIYAATLASLRHPQLVYQNDDSGYHYQKVIADKQYMYLFRSDNKIMYSRSGTGFVESGQKEFVLFPNPCNNAINIWYGWLENPDVWVSLFDLTGKLVLRHHLTKSMEDTIVLGDLSPGIYLLYISGKDIQKSYKILKLPR